jgi:[acyl-carrier-protein] S-malonyltransferase
MTTAFLFPGQGSQNVGMGADLTRFPAAQARFDEADEVLGFSLSDLMFGRGLDADEAAERLKQTEITQPALYVHSLAAAAVLEGEGLGPDMAAGHSLGEYSALAASGACSFADGLRIVRTRGLLMAKAGDGRPGTMAAVLGLDDDVVERVCAEASDAGEGVVVAANYNAPGQVVISGDPGAVDRAIEGAKAAGARRALPLPVSGAFHSPLMEEARAELGAALQGIDWQTPRCPVYLNVTAQPTTDPAEIRARLLEQLTSPVRWSQTLQAMQAGGAARFVEVGTGNVLSGLAKRTLGRQTDTAQAGTAADVDALGA